MALRLIACTVAASAAVGTLAGASFTVGTADALHSAPLFLSNVQNCEAHNQCNNCYYDDIIHKTAPLRNLLLQCVFLCQLLVCVGAQINDHGHDGGNHD